MQPLKDYMTQEQEKEKQLKRYIKPVLKVFKHLKSLQIWSLSVGFWCFNIGLLLN